MMLVRQSFINHRCNAKSKSHKLTDSRIVYTVNDDLLDSGFLESFLFLKVSRNLSRRSGGGEGSWKTNDDDVLSSAVVSDVDLLHIRESLHNLN